MKGLFIALGAIAAIAAAASALAFIGLPYRPLGVEFIQNNPYAPTAISAQATGSQTPSQIPNPSLDDFIVINGDFRILLGAGPNVALGDGINEVTVWDFDFSHDSQFDQFPTNAQLETARLTITIIPKSEMFANDTMRIAGLQPFSPAIYAELPLDSPSDLQLELLDFYTSQEILQALTAGNGKIAMVSGSNSIVSSAELVLVSGGPLVSQELSGAATLSGQVILQNGNRESLGGTSISAFGGGNPLTMRAVTTDSDGSFLMNLSPGDYRLMVNRHGWQPHSEQITIAGGEVVLEPVHLSLGDPDDPDQVEPLEFETTQCPENQSSGMMQAALRGHQDNGLLFHLDVALDQPARVGVRYYPAGDADNTLMTPLTESAALNHELGITRVRPDTTYCFQVFAIPENGGDPIGTDQISELFQGSFVSGSLPPGLDGEPFQHIFGQKTYPMTLLDFNNGVFQGMVAIDGAGDVVWFHQHSADVFQIGQADDYNLVFGELGGDRLIEIRPDGTLVREVVDTLEDGTACTPSGRWHHEILFHPEGGVYTLGSEIREVEIGGEVRQVTGDTVVVWDRDQGTVETVVSLFDLLDPEVDRTSASDAMGGFFWRGCDVDWQMAESDAEQVGVEDWTHANSLWLGAEGNMILSLRHLNQIISIAPDLQSVQWRLGGPNSDFHFPDPTDQFYHQHTAQELPNGNILLFDNGATRPDEEGGEYSRALELELDFEAMEARKVWEYRHGPDLFAHCCSSVERLENGNTVLVFGADHTEDPCCRTFTLVEADGEGNPVSIMEISSPDLSIVYRVYPIESIGGEAPAP
jgi:hypothetical protein